MTKRRTTCISIDLMARADGASQWVHIIPAGTFTGRDGRGPFTLGDANTVINNSRAHAGRRLMPIDYDHAIDLAAPNGSAAPAAGWIKGLQSRADGIWGLVDWTPRAAEQLAQREYRYLSPVFTTTSDGTVTSVLRASLTNNPNLDQITALASMEASTMDPLVELRTLLNLPDTATLEEVVVAVRELTTSRHSAAPDPSKFVPIGDFEHAVAEVNRLNKGIELNAATAHVEEVIRSGKMFPFMRSWAIELCTVNKPAFDAFVEKTHRAPGGPRAFSAMSKITADYQPNLNSSRGQLSDEEIAVAANLGVSQENFLKSKQSRSSASEY